MACSALDLDGARPSSRLTLVVEAVLKDSGPDAFMVRQVCSDAALAEVVFARPASGPAFCKLRASLLMVVAALQGCAMPSRQL